MTTPKLACPECESTRWESFEACSETLRLRIYTDNPDKPEGTAKSIWYETTDIELWRCENQHQAPDDLEDRLTELRGELDFVT